MSNEIKLRIVYVLTRKNKADADDTDLYVGSTSHRLGKRLYQHLYNSENFIKRGLSEDNRLYKRIREVGLENWEVLPLLSRTCDVKTIRELERKWVRILGAGLNSYLPITSKEEKKEHRANYVLCFNPLNHSCCFHATSLLICYLTFPLFHA